MIRHEYNITGKEVITYEPKDGKSYRAEDIGRYLKRFCLNEALRLIGEISYRIANSGLPVQVIRGIPIGDFILAYLSMRLIENSNDYRSKIMQLPDLLKACDMYFGLPDPLTANNDAEACLMRFGQVQFDYDREMRNLLARTVAIYRELWPHVPEASSVDIDTALKQISGLELEEILLFGLAFGGRLNRERGFFRIYQDSELDDEGLKERFSEGRQLKFIKWISCDYNTFRKRAKSQEVPSPDFEKYRFNPLCVTPIIVPDRNPQPWNPPVYIVPIFRFLHERVTRGLYFDLSDFFARPGKRNDFRTAFGAVFQEYVGLLLRKAIGPKHILGEFEYGKMKKTPDWIILEDQRAILIEVKQSGLYLRAKTWGELEDIKKDLSQTIGHGVKQLLTFEQDMKRGGYEELKCLSGAKEIERLVITYDRPYFLNSILREKIKEILHKENVQISQDYHWHSISVEEFEYLIGVYSYQIFDILKQKRLDDKYDSMDFRDYLARLSEKKPSNPYLDVLNKQFLTKMGVPTITP